MMEKAVSPSLGRRPVADEHLLDAMREALLNLDSLEGEVKLVKRRLSEHLAQHEGLD